MIAECFHVAFASDRGYALQLKICVASLLHACRHNPYGLVVDVLDDGIGNDTWEDMSTLWGEIAPWAKVRRHEICGEAFDGFKKWRGSRTAYARLLLPSLLPPDLRWCLYADCDTFFVRDPRALSDETNDEVALMGHAISPGRNPTDVKWLLDRGYRVDVDCFLCSGFVMINLVLFRKAHIADKCLEFLRVNPDSCTPDQSALNVVCQGLMGQLSEGWGVFMDEAMQTPFCGCIHFAGLPPWKSISHWTHFCGESKIFDIWYDFAEQKCHLPGIRDKYRAKAPSQRTMAAIVHPVLIVLSFARLYPKKCFEQHASAIRKRVMHNVPKRIREDMKLQ